MFDASTINVYVCKFRVFVFLCVYVAAVIIWKICSPPQPTHPIYAFACPNPRCIESWVPVILRRCTNYPISSSYHLHQHKLICFTNNTSKFRTNYTNQRFLVSHFSLLSHKIIVCLYVREESIHKSAREGFIQKSVREWFIHKYVREGIIHKSVKGMIYPKVYQGKDLSKSLSREGFIHKSIREWFTYYIFH